MKHTSKLDQWVSAQVLALYLVLRCRKQAIAQAVRFYAQVWRTQGMDGLQAAYRLWRASKQVSTTYGHIERELALHEEHMALLHMELAHARREYHRARAGVHGLFAD